MATSSLDRHASGESQGVRYAARERANGMPIRAKAPIGGPGPAISPRLAALPQDCLKHPLRTHVNRRSVVSRVSRRLVDGPVDPKEQLRLFFARRPDRRAAPIGSSIRSLKSSVAGPGVAREIGAKAP